MEFKGKYYLVTDLKEYDGISEGSKGNFGISKDGTALISFIRLNSIFKGLDTLSLNQVDLQRQLEWRLGTSKFHLNKYYLYFDLVFIKELRYRWTSNLSSIVYDKLSGVIWDLKNLQYRYDHDTKNPAIVETKRDLLDHLYKDLGKLVYDQHIESIATKKAIKAKIKEITALEHSEYNEN